MIVPRKRLIYRPRFALQEVGAAAAAVYLGASSEWLLFHALRDISRRRGSLAWLECNGHRLTRRSLDGLNVYIRAGVMARWKSSRFCKSGGHELIGAGEWARFCRVLDLKFEGKGVDQDGAPVPVAGR